MRTAHLIRSGHMGDVLISQPIAGRLRRDFDYIKLYTEYVEAGLLLEGIDEVHPFSKRPEPNSVPPGDRIISLLYETIPGINHLDGFATAAGVKLDYRLPRIKRGAKRIIAEGYGLIAPRTSRWIQNMRQWSMESFSELGSRLESKLGLPVVMLDDRHSFSEMVSLIEHCNFFVGNDSGPAILAQSFNVPSFVIFGATKPDLVLLNENACAILINVGCNGCIHTRRHAEIECTWTLCLNELSVHSVFNQVVAKLDRSGLPQSISSQII